MNLTIIIRCLQTIIVASILVACSSPEPPTTHHVSLDEAKQLIVDGRVDTIFQPHQGPVQLHLRSGQDVYFNQPHIDWVLDFVNDNSLNDNIEAIATE